jgi:hypothetical protein
MCKRGFDKAGMLKQPRPLWTAVRRYLQATFARGEVFPEWSTDFLSIEHPDSSYEGRQVHPLKENRDDIYEDALLHYAFALEALLTGDDREAINEKNALSAALLIGRDDRESGKVRAFIKKAYDTRSALVHGRGSKGGKIDIIKLRRICQRVLSMALCFFEAEQNPDWGALLRDLPVSRERQSLIGQLRERIFPLLADDASLAEGS